MKPTTDENLRKAIEIIDEVSLPHPDQQWAIEQLICVAHAIGILRLRNERLKDKEAAGDNSRYVDEAGETWYRPSAWAYAQACKTIERLKAERARHGFGECSIGEKK